MQVHDLPVRYMNKAITEKVCGILEEVLHSLENALIKEGGGGRELYSS